MQVMQQEFLSCSFLEGRGVETFPTGITYGLHLSIILPIFVEHFGGTQGFMVVLSKPNDINGVKIPSCTMAGSCYFVPFPVFYTQAAVGRPHLVHSLQFIPESIFYTQSVMLSPCFIPQPVCYTQSAFYTDQSGKHPTI